MTKNIDRHEPQDAPDAIDAIDTLLASSEEITEAEVRVGIALLREQAHLRRNR